MFNINIIVIFYVIKKTISCVIFHLFLRKKKKDFLFIQLKLKIIIFFFILRKIKITNSDRLSCVMLFRPLDFNKNNKENIQKIDNNTITISFTKKQTKQSTTNYKKLNSL